MTSSPSAEVGAQLPRVECLPDSWEWSHADDAAFLATAYGLDPDPWQKHILDAWFAENARGKWACTRAGLAVPRQNGKNAVLEIRELYGMVALGEKFLHTAHEVKTARKAFLRLASFFENERQWPELAALATTIRKTNGQEAIVLSNGGSVEFVARSRGSGRGYTVDVLVLDEAQELTDEQLEALRPTISSAPLKNPQTIQTGTPPPPGTAAEVFERSRGAALAGAKRTAWHEWSIDEALEDVDLDDRELWYATNPSLGIRLSLDVIEDERADMSDDGFARERLGSWKRTGMVSAIDPFKWARAADEKSSPGDPVAFGVDVTPDRERASIGMAGRRDDGRMHVELVDNHSGTAWVADRLRELADRWKPCAVVVDAGGPANSLIEPLKEAGFEIVEMSTRQITAACGGFYDDLTEGQLAHLGQVELDAAVQSARKRGVGDGAWLWSRRDLTDISPLVAVTLARQAFIQADRVEMALPDVVLI